MTNPVMRLWDDNDKVRRTRKMDYIIPYTSRYSGGFALMDTMRVPRACAYQSFKLADVEYYRGQNEQQYKISSLNTETFVVTQMSSNSDLIYQNGESAASVARYDQTDYSVWVQTDQEEMVGTQKTIIRDCDKLNRLLELNLYIEVLSNTHPDFETEVETAFTLDVGETFTYKLPPVIDSDGNDESEVKIDVMEAQEDKYPEGWLTFMSSTNTITMRPRDIYLAGHTFYFTIIVKEKNSESVMYPYYCTIKMNGEITEPDYSIDYKDVNYSVTHFDYHPNGSINFTRPINLTFVKENFLDIFHIYWRDTTYNENNENHTLKDFKIIDIINGTHIYFNMTFEEPYMLGLLVKKSDRLYIDVKPTFNYSGMFEGNATEWRLITKSNYTRLEMIFDMENPTM